MRMAGLASLPLAVMLAFGARAGRADVVILDNGARIEGTVISDDAVGVVLERQSGGSLARMSFPRARVKSIERTKVDSAPSRPGDPVPPGSSAPLAAATRDEWWLLESGGRIFGSRHLLLIATEVGTAKGWRLDERILFLARAKEPAVEIRRVEDTTADFLPLGVSYRERGDGDVAARAAGYQIARFGPVVDGFWDVLDQSSGARQTSLRIAVPARARSPLAAREFLVRTVPRRPGLVDFPMIDSQRGEVRVVRAGFTSLGGGDGAVREDVLRIEDGDRALESSWAPGDPPRCVLEEIAPGVVARPATEAQVRAALAPKAEGPAAPSLGDSPMTPGGRRDIVHPEFGFAFALPGASWVSEPVEPRADDDGPRLVSKASSRIHMADLRVEWDPKGADKTTSPEQPLLEKLRRLARDLAVVEPRTPLAGRPSTYWLGLVGTQRGEKLRMLLLAGDRGAGRVTLLLTCPESSWPDAHDALDAILASFRWM